MHFLITPLCAYAEINLVKLFDINEGKIVLPYKSLLQGIASFISYSKNAGICIAVSEKILRNSKTEDFDRIIERLNQKSQARAVVLFVDEDNTR